MATQAAITRWDKVLSEVQTHRAAWMGAEAMTPAIRRDYARDLPMIVNMIFMPFLDAWQTDRPTEGTDLYEALEPVNLAATATLDFNQAALPQVEPKMAVVAEARAKLAELTGGSSIDEIISDLEHLLKVTVLVARVSHQGAIKIADTELEERFDALNKNRSRTAKYLDLHTMQTVEAPSKRTISLAVFLAMVDPGAATPQEWMRSMDEEDLPPIMKQFAAQWVVNVYTEWDEHFREQLATAHECRKEEIRSEYFADLGKMRHDYVHNRGICRNSARNKVLKWFAKGDTMIPRHADYLQLLECFPSDELRQVQQASPVTSQRQPVKANADPELTRRFLATADNLRITKDAALDQALADWIASRQQTDRDRP